MSTRRRSTRAKALQSYAECDGDQDQESDYTAKESEGDVPTMTVASPKKRKRRASDKPNSKRRRNQREGRLEDFKKLPVELKLYIFEMLHPKTLILMSRTNQEYRNFLLSADSVWKQSRLRLGMPDLEAKDITERQYILLMFDKTCHGTDCNQLHIQDMNWISCARLCASCRRSTKTTRGKFRRYIATLHPFAQLCAKDTGEDAAGSWIPRGIEKLSERLWNMTARESTDFVQQRQALKVCIEKDAMNICDWICEESVAKRGSDSENRQAREGQIKERLLALGWTEESLSMTYWYLNARVTQPRRLTDTIWRRIKDPLLQDMYPDLLHARNRSRRSALQSKYRQLLEFHPTPDLFPSCRVFLEMPSVKGIWEETTNPLPDSIDVADFVVYDDTKWIAALPAIQADVLRYEEETEALAIARLTAAYVAQSLPVPSHADILNDPRSLFCYASGSFHVKNDIIMPFPAIHREIRDKCQEGGFRFHLDEFRTLREPNQAWAGGSRLHVQLKL